MSKIKEPDIARLYHLNSSNVRCRVADLDVDYDNHPMRFRTYPGSARVSLEGKDFDLDIPLGTVLQSRRSIREYALRSLTLPTLGRLLYASYGVEGHRQVEGQLTYSRPAPSAGGLYPLELYVVTQAVDQLADGIYHYDARAHQLELRRSGLFHSDIAKMTIGQDMIRNVNLVVMISAIFERTMWKYGQRGYRYVWLDAGHVGQNLYLVATALRLGAVAIGGFFDSELHDLLCLPADEEVIYLVCVGQRMAEAPETPG